MANEDNICVRLRGREKYLALSKVLRYEALVRGDLPVGQMAYDLVMDAVDLDSYPDDVREQLAAIDPDLLTRKSEPENLRG